VERLRKEQLAHDEKHGKNTVQFYNEMLSYFFPWDVVGIEIGGMNATVSSILLKKINQYRRQFITKLRLFVDKSDKEINQTVKYYKTNTKHNTIANLDDTLFIFVKFLISCECGTPDFSFSLVDIKNTAEVIIQILQEPIKFYEYGRQSPSGQFRLTELAGTCQRRTPFELFVRHKDMKSKSLPITNLTRSLSQFRTETLIRRGTRKTKSSRSQNPTRRLRVR
jgi:hypothetical protein